jgi:hypothetical protein
MSKTLHVVNHRINIDQTDDPTDLTTSQIDLALALSKTLGRNIRQGHSFRVVGVNAVLDHSMASDADTGLAAAVKLNYCPTNRHGVKAWNTMFKQWKRQKLLSNKVGQSVRYDDLELCFGGGYSTPRTSTIYASGLGDTTTEYISMYDNAASGLRTSLEDSYNSRNPIPQNSTDEFGVSIKEPKFTTHFPNRNSLMLTAHMSAKASWTRTIGFSAGIVTGTDADAGSTHYMGGSASTGMLSFPGGANIQAMCGLLQASVALLPHDVDSGPDPPTAEGNWYVDLTIFVEGWTPLAESAPRSAAVSKPKRRITKRKKTTSKRRRRS